MNDTDSLPAILDEIEASTQDQEKRALVKALRSLTILDGNATISEITAILTPRK